MNFICPKCGCVYEADSPGCPACGFTPKKQAPVESRTAENVHKSSPVFRVIGVFIAVCTLFCLVCFFCGVNFSVLIATPIVRLILALLFPPLLVFWLL